MASTKVPDDRRLTTVGLLFEASAGLRRLFERQLEEQRALPSQSMDVLIRLARSPGDQLRMSELASQTSLSPSGLTRAVDRLQQQGLVTRRTCSEDRRGAFAVLTDEGRALMARLIPEHLAHIDDILDTLFSGDEEEQLASSLRRLRDYTHAELGGAAPDGGCPSL